MLTFVKGVKLGLSQYGKNIHLKERKEDGGENCTAKSFIICAVHQMLLGSLNQE
jgi:hypothetical protein